MNVDDTLAFSRATASGPAAASGNITGTTTNAAVLCSSRFVNYIYGPAFNLLTAILRSNPCTWGFLVRALRLILSFSGGGGGVQSSCSLGQQGVLDCTAAELAVE